ncbi:MAG: 50S ribosomal protein L17 [Candidatus Binatia bacterium]
MRHLKSGRKLNRTSSHRTALMRNLVTSLLLHERIRTTDAKAKELKAWADRVISLGKRGDLHARRQALQVINDKAVVRKLFDTLAERFKSRPGGYTRVIKVGWRVGDRAPVSVVELVEGGGEAAKPKAGGRRRRRAAKEASKPSAETAATAT